MRILNKQEVTDILVGCTVLGTGGGGSLEEGLSSISKAFQAGKEFKLLNFEDIQDHGYYINPYFCGCILPEDQQGGAVKPSSSHLTSAIQILEDYMKVDFHGVVSIEYGGGNTGHAMAAAAFMDKYIVDADAAGRAVPELQFSTYFVTNRPIFPFSVATAFGDQVLIPFVESDARAEALSRWMAVGSGGLVGMADHPILGSDLRSSVIPKALSYAEKIGRAQRQALSSGEDPVSAVVEAGNGSLLFQGKVTSKTQWEVKEGFTIGTIHLQNDQGDSFKIWYKNENMISWKNGTVYMTCPDLICTVDSSTGYPITNPNCTAGDEVSVLGFEAHPLWRTPRGASILNPEFFGFDMKPVSLKEAVQAQ